tara:strand:- start:8031 stop:8213 length:183 start_codon:yes stop_codon:yes gene_type:complete
MKVRITDTTDRQHLGFVFDSNVNTIKLHGGIEVPVEKKMSLPSGGMRFINSNYIIDTVKV